MTALWGLLHETFILTMMQPSRPSLLPMALSPDTITMEVSVYVGNLGE